MNRSIWTWIQLAASLCNALFLIIGHVPETLSAVESASARMGQAAHRAIATAAQEIHPLTRIVEATL